MKGCPVFVELGPYESFTGVVERGIALEEKGDDAADAVDAAGSVRCGDGGAPGEDDRHEVDDLGDAVFREEPG